MAECHPVGFQWVVEAQRRGAVVIHVDPRFTRTSALADLHVPIRAGSDVAFLGGIVNHILENGLEFREYVVHYTNAATIVGEEFADTEDLDGLFSGWDPHSAGYDSASWQYERMAAQPSAGGRDTSSADEESTGRVGGTQRGRGTSPRVDATLEHPRCVFQILKRHFRRYTPEMVSRACGISEELFLEVAGTLVESSGPERTAAFCYAVGWTQHSIGVQYIRTASIIQLLLGNIGRPGGGILALRGHASIQGSTDIPTLYDLLPGYLPMPHSGRHPDLATYVESESSNAGFWAGLDAYTVSLLKAWWGGAASEDNDYCFDHLPRLTGDHSAYQTTLAMLDGDVKGYFLLGENPAVGSANSRLHRLALSRLDWLVVRDFHEIESASWWYESPEVESGEIVPGQVGTEVFLMPAASHTEKSGSFTNTQRLLQWHDAAVEPEDERRSELWFAYHLGRIIRGKLGSSPDDRDGPVLDLTWEYPTRGPHDEPDPEAVLREINGTGASGEPLSSSTELAADGSTSCGCWIYCGCFAHGENQTRRRRPGQEQDWVASEWAWAWPDNRRILYNRASADPQGRPWSERKRYVWWDEDQGRWTGHDSPDFVADRPPDHQPPEDAVGREAHAGDAPFVMQEDGRGWLYVPTGLEDGPLPTHYEPQESPVRNPLYGTERNPARVEYHRPLNQYNPTAGEPGADRYPYVLTSYRLTEHHTAGAMSRTVPHLAELQPEMFCEVSPALAAERGLEHGGWATIVTSTTAIEARVMVTRRIPPLRLGDAVVHQVGVPYHWGTRGLTVGDSANDLFPLVLDPNVHIQEVKAATCDVVAGRRPRGAELRRFVEEHRRGPR